MSKMSDLSLDTPGKRLVRNLNPTPSGFRSGSFPPELPAEMKLGRRFEKIPG